MHSMHIVYVATVGVNLATDCAMLRGTFVATELLGGRPWSHQLHVHPSCLMSCCCAVGQCLIPMQRGQQFTLPMVVVVVG
jgi:hypothetical protein